MKIITQDRAKKLVLLHKNEIADLLSNIKSIANQDDKDRHIANDGIGFLCKVDGVVTQMAIKFAFDLKHLTITEGLSSADSYVFSLDEILAKESKVKKEVKGVAKKVSKVTKATKTTTRKTTTRKAKEKVATNVGAAKA